MKPRGALIALPFFAFALMACGGPSDELPGTEITHKTGRMRILNLAEGPLEVKFGSQLNATPLGVAEGTATQKVRAGAVKFEAKRDGKVLASSEVSVEADQVTTLIFREAAGRLDFDAITEGKADKPAPGSSNLVVAFVGGEGAPETLSVSHESGSGELKKGAVLRAEGLKGGETEVSTSWAEGASQKFPCEIEEGGSFTLFIYFHGSSIKHTLLRTDTKMVPTGESGASN